MNLKKWFWINGFLLPVVTLMAQYPRVLDLVQSSSNLEKSSSNLEKSSSNLEKSSSNLEKSSSNLEKSSSNLDWINPTQGESV